MEQRIQFQRRPASPGPMPRCAVSSPRPRQTQTPQVAPVGDGRVPVDGAVSHGSCAASGSATTWAAENGDTVEGALGTRRKVARRGRANGSSPRRPVGRVMLSGSGARVHSWDRSSWFATRAALRCRRMTAALSEPPSPRSTILQHFQVGGIERQRLAAVARRRQHQARRPSRAGTTVAGGSRNGLRPSASLVLGGARVAASSRATVRKRSRAMPKRSASTMPSASAARLVGTEQVGGEFRRRGPPSRADHAAPRVAITASTGAARSMRHHPTNMRASPAAMRALDRKAVPRRTRCPHPRSDKQPSAGWPAAPW